MANIDRAVTTTDAGIPAPSDEHSLTIGPNGPILLQDHYLIQKMAQFNRERVPERVVHAKGSGAHGFFEATEDVSQFTKAGFLRKGTRTDVFVRFSTVAGELGSADTKRDPRGFAIKFYTDEGNYDLVGNNTPIFFIRDPQKFQDFIHSQKRRADTGMRDNNMQWDFWTLSPESAHQVTFLMSDRGTPRTLRNMNGYGSHTFTWVNAGGEAFFVKYHFKTDQGIENFTDAEAEAMTAEDPDFHRRDLWNAMKAGEASWTLEMQIMPVADAADYRFNPFDLTKVWPHSDYPPIRVGRLVLDRNPENHFAEVEQSAFEPSNMVPGIEPSPDKMLLGRLFSYPDTHRHRIGPNYLQLPINRPRSEVASYNRDGPMRYDNPGDPVYAPNSMGGPAADPERFGEKFHMGVTGEIVRAAYTAHAEDDDFTQPRALWEHVLSDTDRANLVSNIVGHASQDVEKDMQKRVVEYWTNVHPELGNGVADGLGI
ncbi:MAG: catalase [Actinomycetota bacterium]|nr:catalase [Actinomycetota bacterium]